MVQNLWRLSRYACVWHYCDIAAGLTALFSVFTVVLSWMNCCWNACTSIYELKAVNLSICLCTCNLALKPSANHPNFPSYYSKAQRNTHRPKKVTVHKICLLCIVCVGPCVRPVNTVIQRKAAGCSFVLDIAGQCRLHAIHSIPCLYASWAEPRSEATPPPASTSQDSHHRLCIFCTPSLRMVQMLAKKNKRKVISTSLLPHPGLIYSYS